MLKRFLSYYKPYLKTFTLDMCCALGNSATGILYPILTRYMLNDLIPNRKFNQIILFGGILLMAYVLKRLMKYSVDYYGHMVGTRLQADMRRELFAKLERYQLELGITYCHKASISRIQPNILFYK